MSEHFTFDAFAARHLVEWFEAGHAPNDWDRETLEAFSAWVIDNAEDFSEYASWPTLAGLFDRVRS